MTILRRNVYIQREQDTSKPQSLSDTIICAVYDILYAPHLLHQNDCDQLFCDLFDKMHASAIFPSISTDVANGVVLLAYHHHRIVRSWARKLLDRLATDQYILEDPDTHVQHAPQYYANPPADFITDTIKLTNDIGERSKAFRATINILGPDQLKKIMDDTTTSVQQWISQQISNLASENSNIMQETIRIMTVLLQKLGRNFWGNEVDLPDTHHNFLKRVCEDQGFQAIMKIARQSNTGKVLQRDGTVYPEDKLIIRIKGMLSWIYFYWSALPDDVQDQTADSILNMLWGYFQLNSWAIICKACCAELGFKVIEDSLARGGDKCPYDKLNEYASTAVWFASIPLAQLPKTFRHIPELAARVLTQALRQDALNIRERVIAISQSSNEEQQEQQQQQQNSSRIGLQSVWLAIGDAYKKQPDVIEPRVILVTIEGYSPLVIVDLPISNKRHPLYTSNKGSTLMKQISTIRQIFSDVLRYATSSTTTASIHERLKLYEQSDIISTVLPLTCSPYVDEIRKPILQLLSVSNSNKTNLQEQFTFRHYVDEQPRRVLEALSVILDDFNNLAMPLVALDSFKLVGPLNQTLTHLITAIVGDEESYMLQLVIMGDYTSEEHRVIKLFWDTCWRTMALIFGKAMEWSGTHKSREVVDATIALFDTAKMMIGARQVFQKAVDSSAPVDTDLSSFDDTSQLQYEHVKEAFDSLSCWIIVTRAEVIQKLVPLIILMLNHLQNIHIKIPEDVCKRLTLAATGVTPTRLLQESKDSLLAALRGHQPEKIIIYDSDEEENWQLVEPSYYTSPSHYDHHQNTSSRMPPKITSYFSKTQDDAPFDDNDLILDDFGTSNETAPISSLDTQHVDLTDENGNNNDDNEFMDEFGELDISALPDEWFEGAITSPTSITVDSNTGQQDAKTSAEPVTDSNNTSVTSQPGKKSIAAAIQAQQTELWKQYEQQKAKEQLAQQQRQRQQQQWSSTFTPKTQKPQVYAVTSTGRKLRPPPTGFSKLKALRAEFKAENKLIAASKSPSASASSRNRNRNSSNGDNSDSSTESSDDDDDGLQGLVDDVNQSKTKHGGEITEQDKSKRADEERASMKALFEQPVKRSTKMIETKSTQAFLEKRQLIKRAEQRRKKITPDIDRFFRVILSWDITVNSEIPPDAYKGMYNKVGDKFNTHEDYLTNFEPLLLLEVWMQLLRARDALTENDVIDRCILDSRCHVNDFVDVTFGVPLNSVNSLIIDDFVCVANHFGDEFFQRSNLDYITSDEPLQKPTSWKGRCFLGKVMAVTQKKSISEVTLRCFFSPERIILLNSLSPKTSWRMLKLTSVTTFQREYAALQGLEHYDLVQHILNPKQYRMPVFTDHMVDKCIEKYGVNDPQARAILGALDKKRGFTLIQGPPGTGKTKTILGLIVSLLDEQRDRRRQKERGIRIDTDGSEYTGDGKILVCAPSNAAVDEIAKRLQEGIMTSQGLSKPKVVRIGTPEAANVSVREILLDRLVEKELAPTIGDTEETKNFGERRGKLSEDIRKVQLDIDDIDREMSECKGGSPETMSRLTTLKDKRKECVAKRNKYKYMIKGILEAQRDFTREQELSRHRARQKVFASVDIVCATLSGSGNEMLTSMGLMFETVVVDEAAQSVEISSLIPLKYDCKRCILVGDPNQLPPTVLSQMAAKYSYEQSLFMRLQKNAPDNVYLLSIQYRMHPEISRFPSKLFYSSRLLDGPDMEVTTAAPWHSQEYFPPYRFYNVEDGMERTGYGKSIYNTAEAEAAVTLVDMLANRLPNVKLAYRIGIITPYKQQLSHIKHRFEKRYGPKILDVIDFNTVDGFQGQEKDIIVFSCVRALSDRGIGFLADMRRMNVGLTRAKSSLFVLGHKSSLMRSEYWGDLVRDAIDRETIVNVSNDLFGDDQRFFFISN
ncbi:AAA domain-containing protein [Phascolomyces articulosus]|uniref:AAA domain-containing protein n=1 Tax=Phascolomyces articulosus TaxID=60185 RepID=A0AAD5KN55_9FUNG|nr:AAA domain-containing protein [Phascolomyces articulosus]